LGFQKGILKHHKTPFTTYLSVVIRVIQARVNQNIQQAVM